MLKEIIIPVGYDPYDYDNLVVQAINGLDNDELGFEIVDGPFPGSKDAHPRTNATLDLYRTIVSATYVTASLYTPSYLSKSGDKPRVTDLSQFKLGPDSPEALIHLTSDIVSSINRGDLETPYKLVQGLETGEDQFRATTFATLAQRMTRFVNLSSLPEDQSSFMRALARGLAVTALFRGKFNSLSSHNLDTIATTEAQRFAGYDLHRIFRFGQDPLGEMGMYITQMIPAAEIVDPQAMRALVQVGLVEPCRMMTPERQK